MSSSKIIDLNPNDDLQNFIDNDCPLIVDFYATWCPPCKKLAPILEEECKKNNINLCRINVDQHRTLANKYKISGIPRVFLFKDKQIVMSFTGLRPDKLKTMIEVALGIYKGSLEDLKENEIPRPNPFIVYFILFVVWIIYIYFKKNK